jgi:hypothetical protein
VEDRRLRIDGPDLCAHLREDGGGIDLSAQVQRKKLVGAPEDVEVDLRNAGICERFCACIGDAGLGLVGALTVTHLMASLLYGVSPYDLSTVAGVTVVLTAVAIAASYMPAERAMRHDPIMTLHSE